MLRTPRVEHAKTEQATKTQSGIASVYGNESGTRTASGRHLQLSALTAAHRTLPFGTKVLVTNKRNGRTVTVEIIDRGPFVKGPHHRCDARCPRGLWDFPA